MKHLKKYIIGLLLIVGLLGSAAIAYAAQGDGDGTLFARRGGPGHGPRVGGEITAVDGNTITVENPRNGEGIIVTTEETEFIVDGEAGSLADVTVGKFAGGEGEKQDDGSLLAARIMVHNEAPPHPHDGNGRPQWGLQGQ